MPRTDDSLITARRIAEAIIAVVNDRPTGAPGDLLFAPLQQWITRDQFEQTMRVLVEAQRSALTATSRSVHRTPGRTAADLALPKSRTFHGSPGCPSRNSQ
jgi:hypothetical protein